MGLRIRKSINIGGGFRVNISKHGVGYSWGVPGYRRTVTSRGTTRKTYSIPKTGISYVSEKGMSQKRTGKKQPVAMNSTPDQIFDSGSIDNYQNADYQEFLDGISNYKRWDLIANILICTVLLSSTPFFILTTLCGVVLKFFVLLKLPISLEYDFNDGMASKYETMKKNWLNLNSSSKLWQVLTNTSLSSLNDQKRNAGASGLITRQPIKIYAKTPRFIKSNTTFLFLKLKKEKLYFMPDKILIIQGKKVGAISYKDLDISGRDYRFIETEKVPKDSEVIEYTWKKVNKDGSPDKRFQGNSQVPVCKYGLITITANTGMDIRICCSNNNLINPFRK